MSQTNQAPQTYCLALAREVGPDHRCSTCHLASDNRDLTDQLMLVRGELIRLRVELKKAQDALAQERDAHGITRRKLARATAPAWSIHRRIASPAGAFLMPVPHPWQHGATLQLNAPSEALAVQHAKEMGVTGDVVALEAA